MDIKKEFYSKLSGNKFRINWSKNLIKMDVFLSFLTVPVVRSINHLGFDTNWTLLENEELNLRISGGLIKKIEYLNTLKFGNRLANPYNDYVNPFYLWDIFNNSGKEFFVNYYADDIIEIIDNTSKIIDHTQAVLETLKNTHRRMIEEVNYLNSIKSGNAEKI